MLLPAGIMPISANDSGCQITTGTVTLVNFVLKLLEVAVDEITTIVLPVASALTDDFASFTVTTKPRFCSLVFTAVSAVLSVVEAAINRADRDTVTLTGLEVVGAPTLSVATAVKL